MIRSSGYAVRKIKKVVKLNSQKQISDTIMVQENHFLYSLNSFEAMMVINFSATTKNRII
jgi:hypothetical protein